MDCFCRDTPFDARVGSCVFGIPDNLRQFCGIFFVSMYKALFVVVETGLEFRFTATIAMSGYFVRLQCSFVYNGAFATFSFQRAVGLIPTVTRWCGTAENGSVLKRNFVVLGYDSSHVGHAAAAHFDVIFIAYVM